MTPLFDLVGLVCSTLLAFVLLWRWTDHDSPNDPAGLDPHEIAVAEARLAFARATLKTLSKTAGLKRCPTLGFAHTGAHYQASRHRVRLSRACLARLSDDDLVFVLAHEVGHATRRFATLFTVASAQDEARCDLMAMRLTGGSAARAESAVKGVREAERYALRG